MRFGREGKRAYFENNCAPQAWLAMCALVEEEREKRGTELKLRKFQIEVGRSGTTQGPIISWPAAEVETCPGGARSHEHGCCSRLLDLCRRHGHA